MRRVRDVHLGAVDGIVGDIQIRIHGGDSYDLAVGCGESSSVLGAG